MYSKNKYIIKKNIKKKSSKKKKYKLNKKPLFRLFSKKFVKFC